MAPLPGRFNDGRTAASRPVGVLAKSDGLHIIGEDGLLVAFWSRADLREETPANGWLRLSCATDEGARLAVEDAPSVRALLPPRRAGLPWLKLGAASAAAVAVIAGLWVGIPAGARGLAALVPLSVEERWGDQVARGLEGQWGRCERPAGEAALQFLGGRIAAGLPAERRPRRVVVVRMPQQNAIALPGGNVMVFSGLLAQAAGPEELAGVLAHEFTHVAERHPTAAMIRAMGIGLLVTMVTGDASGALATASAMAVAGAYSRDDESAADAGAVDLLARAGVDGRGLAAFFRRLEDPGFLPAWLNTHPDPEMRAAAVERMAKPGEAGLTAEQWQTLKRICG